MNSSSKPKLVFSNALFVIGILLGLLLCILAVWADVESVFYGFSRQASEAFPGLHCPIFITPHEKQTVTVNLRNSLDRAISPSIRIEISSPLSFVTSTDSLQLDAGESGRLEKTVGPENIDLGQFIFVKALVYGAFPMPTQQTTCGIFVIPVPGNGKVISLAMMFLSILFLFGSLLLLYQMNLAGNKLRLYSFIAVAIVLAMLFSFVGWWIQSGILLVIIILTSISSVSSLLR